MTFNYEKAKDKYTVELLKTLANVEFFGFEGIDASLRESMDYGCVTTRDEECGCTVILIRPRNSVPKWCALFLRYDFDPYKAWENELNWEGIRAFVGDPEYPKGRRLVEVLLDVQGYCGLGGFLNLNSPRFEIDDYEAEQDGLIWQHGLAERDFPGDEVLPVWVRFEDESQRVSIERGWARRGDDGIAVDLEGGEQLLNCEEVCSANNYVFAKRTVL